MSNWAIYYKDEWSRGEAWEHLRQQQIPGCPMVKHPKRGWIHGWRKGHTVDAWCWRYTHRAGTP